MTIHVDVLARLSDRQIRRETNKLADNLDQSGLRAGASWGNKFIDGSTKEILAGSPKVQRALNGVAAAGEGVVAANRALSTSAEGVIAAQKGVEKAAERTERAERNLVSATENVTIAVRKEIEAEYNLAQARKSLAADSEKLIIMEERLETAKDRVAQAQRAEIAASEAVTEAQRAEVRAGDDVINSKRAQTQASEKLRVAKRREGDAHRSAAETIRQYTRDVTDGRNASEQMLGYIQDMGTAALRTGRGLGTLASGPVLVMLIDLAKSVVTASQAIALLPAGAAAAAAGMTTLKMATAGFGDTIENIDDAEKFAEAIQKLAPNAQQAALSIRDLVKGPLGDLQQSTQDTVFDGFAEQIERLSNTFLPSVQEMTSEIAESFNSMGMGISNTLMQQGNQSQIQNTLDNIGQAFTNAAPAAGSFTQALLDLMSVGSDFLPELGTSIADVAAEFADFIREARDSGELKTFIREGIDAAKDLAAAVMEIGEVIYDVFGGSDTSTEGFRGDVEGISATIKLLNGDISQIGISWREELDGMTGFAAGLRDAIMDIPEAFATTVNAIIDGINAMIRGVGGMRNSIREMLPTALKWMMPETQFDSTSNYQIPHMKVGDWGGYTTTAEEKQRRDSFFGGGIDGTGGQDAATGTLFGGDFTYPGAPGSGYEKRAVPDAPPEKGGKDPRFDAPASQWSLDSIPIGQFGMGVPGMSTPPPGAGYGAPGYPGSPMTGGPGIGFRKVDPMKVWEAESALMDQRARVEESRMKLLEVMADNDASELDRIRARNDVAAAERDYLKDQSELAEAQMGKFEDMSKGIDQIGAALDADFGISKGLGGIAENLVKFLGNIAMAPQMAKWQAEMEMDPIKGGHGLLGIRGAQNMAAGVSPLLGNPMGTNFGSLMGLPPAGYGLAYPTGQYAVSPYGAMPYPTGNVPAPTILEDTGSVASGPQSRNAAAIIEQVFGSELRGKIGGSRDNNTAKGTHDAGLSIDIPIGPDQMDLGDRINAYLQQNADKLGLKYSIWKNEGRYPSDPSKVGFTSPGHFNHIDAHFDGENVPTGPMPGPMPNMPMTWGAQGGGGGSLPGVGFVPQGMLGNGGLRFANTPGQYSGAQAGANTAGATGPKAIARMIFQQAMSRGYSQHAAQAIVAYALGESSLNPGISGGVQGAGGGGGNAADDEVLGLFQQKAGFARGGGIDPSQRTDPVMNTFAYLNQLEKNRHLPIEQALPATSVGGPLASGAGSAPQKWGPLMDQAGELLGIGAGGGGGSLPGVGFVPQSFGGPGGFGLTPAPAGPSIFGPANGTGTGGSAGQYSPTPFSGGVAAPGLGTRGMGLMGVNPMTPPVPGSAALGGTQVGGLEPYSNPQGGGLGVSQSLMGMASAAASAIPGLGQAAATGMQLANRGIQYAGQLAGIGIDAIMQTFLPTGGSQLAQQGWLPKIVGGLAGASAAVPNTAGGAEGGQQPLTPQQVAQQNAANAASNVNGGGNKTMNVEINNSRDTGDGVVRDLEHHTSQGAGAAFFAGAR